MSKGKLTAKQIADYHRDGYVIVRKLFSKDEIGLLSRAAHEDRALDQHSFSKDDGKGAKIRLSLWNHPGEGIYGMFARCHKLLSHLESDDASTRVSAEIVWPAWLLAPDFRDVVRGHFGDRLMQLGHAVQPLRLQAIERLIDAHFKKVSLEDINRWNVEKKFIRAVYYNVKGTEYSVLEMNLDCEVGTTDGILRNFIVGFHEDVKQFAKYVQK